MSLQNHYTLVHYPLSGACRAIRAVCAEKKLSVHLVRVDPWAPPKELVDLNPAGEVPVLLAAASSSESANALTDTRSGKPDIHLADAADLVVGFVPILEYLEETYPVRPLLPVGSLPMKRAEVRRLYMWFSEKFHREVLAYITGEKLMKRLSRAGTPNSDILRAGKYNLVQHMTYINNLCEERKWLAGENLSLADFTAAAHLSILDYSGDVPWESFPEAKLWYAKTKSRPAFRGLLADRLPGIPPAKDYDNLDF